MADQKISAMTPGAPAAGTDIFPIVRSGANLSLKNSDLLALFLATRPPSGTARKIVFAGDSETANADGGSNGTLNVYLQNHGAPNQFMSRAGGGYNSVFGRNSTTNLPIGGDAGVGGDTSTLLLARYVTDVTSKNPDVVNIEIGTNDLNTASSSTFGTFKTNILSMIAQNQAIGAETWLNTIYPRNNVDGGGGSDFTATARKVRSQINQWLRSLNTVRGITIFDHDTRLCNSSGDMITGYTSDGLHLNGIGAYWVADTMIEALFGTTPPPFIGLFNDAYGVYDATFNINGALLTNSLLAGTGGTVGTQCTGNAATNTTIAATAGSNISAVLSKITMNEGGNTIAGQRFVLTTTGGGISTETIRCRFNSNTAAITTAAANGVWLGGSMLVRVSQSSGTSNLLAAYLQIADQSSSGATVRANYLSGHGPDVDIERTGFWNLPPLQLVGSTGYFVDFNISMDATLSNVITVDLFGPEVHQLVNAPTYM